MNKTKEKKFDWAEAQTETERERKRFASKMASCISAFLKIFSRKGVKEKKTNIEKLKT